MGSFMDFMDDFVFGPLNLIDRAEGLIRQLIYRDTAVKFSVVRMDKGGSHTRPQARTILDEYGIPTFGQTHDSKHVHFLVKRRQAKWAEYLLVNSGVKFDNRPLNQNNYIQRHAPGWMPTPWSARKHPKHRRKR